MLLVFFRFDYFFVFEVCSKPSKNLLGKIGAFTIEMPTSIRREEGQLWFQEWAANLVRFS